MKILIDCSNLQVGGGIQVALSFLYDLREFKRDDIFVVLMSPQISGILNTDDFGSHFTFLKLEKKSYTNFIIRGRAMKKLEEKIIPDVIFTVFGPSYHKSNFPKVVGFAIPHYIYQDSPFFSLLSFKEKIRLYLMQKFQVKLFKKADKLIFETKDAQKRFCTIYNFDIKNTYAISNRLNQIFLKPNLWRNKSFFFKTNYAILCLSANYKHKNLSIIPSVIDTLVRYGLKDFKFVVSLLKHDLKFPSKYDQYIEYIGKIPLEVLPSLYNSVDLLFLPTLLECFSTTYLEAMFMKVPIVTTDLSFAKDVCNDAALYYEPLNADCAAKKIKSVLLDDNVKSDLTLKGINNLKRFGSSYSRTSDYLDIIHEAVDI